MLTLTHIADTHLGHRQYALKQREDDMVSSTRSALQEMVEECGTDAILWPGDLFHSRDLRPRVLHQTEQELERLPDDVPVLVSRGNHDENLTPRDVTWLNYLHQREQIVFLKADLSSDPDVAQFTPYDSENPGDHAGFYDVDSDDLDGPIRVFGLQWRGAKTDQALEQVARGIESANEEYGEPSSTVLLAHFGMEDEVPTLGGTVTHSELRRVKENVDYLALGHIHKRYEAGEWIYNPGSPEAHNTREGQADWGHGFYSVEFGKGASQDVPEEGAFKVEHHSTKRRPYYRFEFDVTEYSSPSDLQAAFRELFRDEQSALAEYCRKEEFVAKGEPRSPIIDLRFNGTLQFSRGDFRTDELAAWLQDECDALYVQVSTGIRSAGVQQLISEIDEDEVFKDGQLNTAVLEDRVFETIAEESIYSDQSDEVAEVLGEAHRMAQAEESVEDIRDSVSTARRELFPDLADGVVLDIDEDPFSDTDQGADESDGMADESSTDTDDVEEVVE